MATIQVDFTGLTPFQPMVEMDEGVYPFKINAPGQLYPDANGRSVKVTLTVTDGKYKGVERFVFVGRDLSKPESKRGLMTNLIACGVDPAKLKGVAPYDEEKTWNGKSGYFHLQPGDRSLEKNIETGKYPEEYYDKVTLILPEAVASMKARYAAGATASGPQSHASASKNGAPAHVIEQPPAAGAAVDEL